MNMKSLKRSLAGFLALVMVIVGISQAFAATPIPMSETGITVSASRVSAQIGEYADVVISLDGNQNGLHSLRLIVDYDETQLEQISITRGSLAPQFRPPASPESLIFWVAAIGQNMYNTGELAIVRFRVLEGASGEIPVTIRDAGDTIRFAPGFSMIPIAPVFNAGSVTVGGGSVQTGTVRIGNIEGFVGDIVSVPVLIENNPGIYAIRFEVERDNRLELIGFEEGLMIVPVEPQSLDSNPVTFVLEAEDYFNIYENGTLITLQFRINQGAEEGLSVIGIEFIDAVNDRLALVPFYTYGGSVYIQGFILGDVNHDRGVDPRDLLLLRQYLARWTLPDIPALGYPISVRASDVNADGIINPADALLLRRYLAGWDVTFGPQPMQANLSLIESMPMVLSVASVSQVAGERVDVEIMLEDNPGVFAIMAEISYDPRLQLTGFTAGSILGVPAPPQNINANPVFFMFEAAGLGNVYGDGTMITLHFNIVEGAEPGDAFVNLQVEGAWCGDFGTPPITGSNGHVTITSAQVTTHNVTFSAGAGGNITVTNDGDGNVATNMVTDVLEGATLTFEAQPNEGFVVGNWTVTGTTNYIVSGATLTINNLDGNVSVSVSFERMPLSTGTLGELIVYAEALNQAEFTPQTWAQMSMALSPARSVYRNVSSTQAQIDTAAQRLQDAINSLQARPVVVPVDRTALGAIIAEAEARAQADYTPQSWAALAMALSPARSIYGNQDATQAQVDNARASLQDAIAGLELLPDEPVIDRDTLRQAIADAEARVQANYTPQTWAQVNMRLSPARSVHNNQNATQAQIDSAANNLINALNGLVARP